MIIKLIPENDMEKARISEVEHRGVREFFIFGTKNVDGEMIDFHDWTGSYKNLIGSISYFNQVLISEMNSKNSQGQELVIKPQARKQPPMIKKSGATDGQIQQILDSKDMEEVIQKAKENEGNPVLKLVTEDNKEDQ